MNPMPIFSTAGRAQTPARYQCVVLSDAPMETPRRYLSNAGILIAMCEPPRVSEDRVSEIISSQRVCHLIILIKVYGMRLVFSVDTHKT